MIAYEELEKALARWKSRRQAPPGGPEARTELAADQAIPTGEEEYGETPAGDSLRATADATHEVELDADGAIVDES